MEPKLDFGNQTLIFGTKMEPKLDFWNQNGTKILKYTEFLSKKRSHEFTPNHPHKGRPQDKPGCWIGKMAPNILACQDVGPKQGPMSPLVPLEPYGAPNLP